MFLPKLLAAAVTAPGRHGQQRRKRSICSSSSAGSARSLSVNPNASCQLGPARKGMDRVTGGVWLHYAWRITMSHLAVSQSPSASLPRTGALISGYLIAYVLLDWLSYLRGITPWNPQAGLTLALLLSGGPRRAIWTAVAAAAAEVIVRGPPVAWLPLVEIAVVIAGGYALAALLLRARGIHGPIESPEHVVSLACVIAPITLAMSILYVLASTNSSEHSMGSVVRYWVGDLNGVLTLTPLLLAAKSWRVGLEGVRQRLWEVGAQIVSILAALWIRLGQHSINDLVYVYPLFVPVVWIAFRWGVVGTALCTLTLQISLIVAADGYADNLLLSNLQFLAVTLGTTGLLLGSTVSSRTAALRRVAAREAEQRAILATAPDAVIATDADGRIVSANPAALQLFALPTAELAGQDLKQWLPSIRLGSDAGRISLEGRRGDGSSVPLDIAWAKLDAPATEGTMLIIRDVTERVANEAKLRDRDTALARAMRFAVVGEFASALTHELNQPITALVSYLQASLILTASLDAPDARLPETLSKATREAMRTSEVLRRLRDFYHRGMSQIETVEPELVIAAVLKTYDDRIRHAGVRLQSSFAANLPAVRADPIQIEMILHNLMSNALDAVLERSENLRNIALSVSRGDTDILIELEDSGPGVAAEVSTSLFDPFITTKPSGMGLGLTISRTLLRSHGGDLWSEPGSLAGARFVVRLPITASPQLAP
jgi:PAS domain S-box-containing protein